MEKIIVVFYSLAIVVGSFSAYIHFLEKFTSYVSKFNKNEGYAITLLLVVIGLDIEILIALSEMYG